MFTKLALRQGLPVLTSERLRMRALTPEDDEVIFQFLNDSEVIQYLNRVNLPTKIRARRIMTEIRLSGAKLESIHYGICLQESGHLIGVVSFQQWKESQKQAHIGYMFNRAYWGQGYAAEALERLIQFGFEELDFTQLEARIHEQNDRSKKLLMRSGFTHKKTEQHFSLLQMQKQDILVYKIDREQYRHNRRGYHESGKLV
ncbi:GNAT family N-acetyltransferase [Paenibacillus polygoni]|uniref:GNAT family N-acetyltransferase n=1 Tax=Paenibacillus polygoni TaxID=3050112 RepID=A0ABY8X2T5_9BACL|nr:GNAT family N-acetyltransferase [Paenibacillus polygoni]WIV18578.1 GNAT family N-acetyltransferase [Paenibacillus polygoni]